MITQPPLTIEFDAKDKNYNMVLFRGVPQNPTFRVDELETLVSTFNSRPTDTFICTYPKCGTTWMQQICHLLSHGGMQGESTMYATAPWLECLCAAPILHEREANSFSLEAIEAKPASEPRFFKSHANLGDLPRGGKQVKVVYVARNPKDTCVSLWHHAREKPEFNLAGGAPRPGSDDPPAPVPVCDDFGDFVQLFLGGKAECGSWFDHTLEWYAASLVDPSVLFITYEDLIKVKGVVGGMVGWTERTQRSPPLVHFAPAHKMRLEAHGLEPFLRTSCALTRCAPFVRQDPAAGIARVAAHVGVGNDAETIARTVANSAMAEMKQTSGERRHARAGLTWSCSINGPLSHCHRACTASFVPGVYAGNVRQGGIGNWRKKLVEHSPLNAMFDGEYVKQMRGSGLRFDFGDGLVL